MAKIPTTEFCPQCANETPENILKRAGRIQTRVYQDLDTGKYECAMGHTVDLGQPDIAPVVTVDPGTVRFEESSSKLPVTAGASAVLDDGQSSIAVEEMPQSGQAQIVPGSSVIKQGGSMEMVLLIPEQYVGALQSYCDGIGKSVEEFVNEVVANGFENGWFV